MSKRVNIEAHPSQLKLGKVDSHILLELFPFALALDRDMRIVRAGEKIIESWMLQNPNKPPEIFLGSFVLDNFKIRRPKGISFVWNTVIQMHTVLFELELGRNSANSANKLLKSGETSANGPGFAGIVAAATAAAATDEGAAALRRGSQGYRSLLLKGQMRYMSDLDNIMFLCSPL